MWVRPWGVTRSVVRDLHLPDDAAVNPGGGGGREGKIEDRVRGRREGRRAGWFLLFFF